MTEAAEPCTCCGKSEDVFRVVHDIAGQVTTTFCPRCDLRKCDVCSEPVMPWVRAHCGKSY